jgi:hypothetical protein
MDSDEEETSAANEVGELEDKLEKIESAYTKLLSAHDIFKLDNSALQRKVVKLSEENVRLRDRVQTMEEEQQRILQQSATSEMLNLETHGKVSKFVKDNLFHHKKFITNESELNNITDGGSMGKLTMDYFEIGEHRRVAWWNTYKKAAADAIANQRSTVSSNIKRELKGKTFRTLLSQETAGVETCTHAMRLLSLCTFNCS